MIFPDDVIIAELIKQGIDDLRKNLWLLDDIFSPFINEPALKEKYGAKEIDAAKDWFTSNKIEVNQQYRNDKEIFPSISIGLGSSTERPDLRSLGELSTVVETLMPNQIGRPIAYIVKPFTPISYDIDTGELILPTSVSTRGVRAGQILVDPDTGNGYIIQEVTTNGIKIEPDTNLTLTRAGVVPQYQIYRARREHAWFSNTIHIGCHVHGDPAALLWLHSIVMYLMLRYREGLLEKRGFMQSTITSSDLMPNPHFDNPSGENVFSRYITMNGLVEHTWIKSPQRVIEAIEIDEETSEGFKSGIKILSNIDSVPELDTINDLWTTKKDE